MQSFSWHNCWVCFIQAKHNPEDCRKLKSDKRISKKNRILYVSPTPLNPVIASKYI